MFVFRKSLGLWIILVSIISGIASFGNLPKSGQLDPLGALGLAITTICVAFGIWQVWLRFVRAGHNGS